MTISIEELSGLAGEDYRRKDEEEAERRAAREAREKPKVEPGRARPKHGMARAPRFPGRSGEYS